MLDANKTNTYPFRAPKKYHKKDLHGRPRIIMMQYRDFRRFQKFYTNVFGWDMFELPQVAGGETKGSEHPTLVAATGPSYETWEGLNPGHMNCMVSYTEGEVSTPTLFTEVHMDRPLADTVMDIVKYGGSHEGELPVEVEGWSSQTFAKDPSRNMLYLWKCPPSRTWEEPEAGYDQD